MQSLFLIKHPFKAGHCFSVYSRFSNSEWFKASVVAQEMEVNFGLRLMRSKE